LNAPVQLPPIAALKIPALLLEGDEDLTRDKPEASGIATLTPETGESSGHAKITLLPRDPHSIYAHWELSAAQKQEISSDEFLVINVRREHVEGALAAQLRVEPQTEHAFIRVPDAGAGYIAELCRPESTSSQVSLGVSAMASTPRENVSLERTAQYARSPVTESPPPERLQEMLSNIPSSPESITPPSVSWIPVLGSSNELPSEKLETAVTQEMILSVQMNYNAEPGWMQPGEWLYETAELERLVRTALEQLKGGGSSFS